MKSFLISIIGRPNVGKSTLFNALITGEKGVITHDLPGVTRDCHYAQLHPEMFELREEAALKWNVQLVDTGGFYPGISLSGEKHQDQEVIYELMSKEVDAVITESDLILFTVDLKSGLLPYDEDIHRLLQKRNKDYLVCINKSDVLSKQEQKHDFYRLGVDESRIFSISAAHQRGIGDLRTQIASLWSQKDREIQSVEPKSSFAATVSIIGMPNSGKSTLLNQLLQKGRSLVSPIAGTTADPVSDRFTLSFTGEEVRSLEEKRREKIFSEEEKKLELEEDQEFQNLAEGYEIPFKIFDTAGIRRKSHIKSFVEKQSVFRALHCIGGSDLVLYVIDAEKGISHQDKRLCEIAIDKGSSLLILFNKVDLVKESFSDPKKEKIYWDDLFAALPWKGYYQALKLSALTGKNIHRVQEGIKKVFLQRYRQISTSKLNSVLQNLIEKNPIVIRQEKKGASTRLKIKYASIISYSPPTVLIFSNRGRNIPEHYRRYLFNGLTQELGLRSTPVRLIFRKMS